MPPLIFCNIAWMREYKGRYRITGEEDIPRNGGRYVNENHEAHECCNFLPDEDGKVYGHVEMWRGGEDGYDTNININMLGASDADNYVDGVDVIWSATPRERGKRVIGWYRKARVYRERQFHENYPTEQHERDNVDSFRIIAKRENVHLINEDERTDDLIIDPNRVRVGFPGMNAVFYPISHRDNKDLVNFIERLYCLIDDKIIERIQSSNIQETQKKALIDSRIGQGTFRKRLIDIWEGCMVTNLTATAFLRASHIKPWRDSTNRERLDPYNGLLLMLNLDIAFDKGYITFNDDGVIDISDRLAEEDREILNIHEGMEIQYELDERHIAYLQYHRQYIFER